jgi:hypothetical protein
VCRCKAFEEWVGLDELFSAGSTGGVGAGHNRSRIGLCSSAERIATAPAPPAKWASPDYALEHRFAT